FFRQSQEELERFVGDPVLGVVEVDAGRLGREALTAPGVVGEQPPEVQVADLPEMGFERLPGRALAQRRHGHGPVPAPRWLGLLPEYLFHLMLSITTRGGMESSMTQAMEVKYASLKPVLDERARRLWAAAEARAIGRGGITRVSQATGLSRVTIRAGLEEIS